MLKSHFTNGETREAPVKSYVSEENLVKALVKLGFDKHRYVIVKTLDDRFTAMFPASECNGFMSLFANHGFYTIG